MDARKTFSRLGFILLLVMIVAQGGQVLMLKLGYWLLPVSWQGDWMTYGSLEIVMWGMALPVMWALTRKIPVVGKGEVRKLRPGEFLFLVPVTEAAGYICNLFGIILLIPLILLLVLKGGNPSDINPLFELMSQGAGVPMFLAVVIFSPAVEELLFRWLLLDRLRRFGDKTAILISALAFGLFHGNPLQFLYATAVGMIFAYITLKTNTVRYSIGLHMILNLFGSLAMYVMMIKNPFLMLKITVLLLVVIFGMVVTGIVFICIRWRRVRFTPGLEPVQRGTGFRTVVLNPGMICFILCCLLLFAAFFASLFIQL